MPLPTLGEEGAVTFEIKLVNLGIAMPLAVVLVDPLSAVDP